jgi:glucan phosphoethanolaminetransferase (alkaline phosphatase superfamily)
MTFFVCDLKKCMVSKLGCLQENLLDILQRTGVDILWSNNNGGCKVVCA